jgi:hypothetical protein
MQATPPVLHGAGRNAVPTAFTELDDDVMDEVGICSL